MNNNGIDKVISGGYCVGCGACSVKDSRIGISENDYGQYVATLPLRVVDEVSEVCPFSALENEDTLGLKYYSDADGYDDKIGHYRGIYTGYVLDPELRDKSSSGGIVTWLLKELLNAGSIDAVIHVKETGQPGNMFQYSISESIEEVQSGAKSRYYPVHFDDVVKSILGDGKRYAFVGIPCFVKAIRLLAKDDERLAEAIVYTVAIFCGHLKSKSFAEMIALQRGVGLKRFSNIDFRVKDYAKPANQYKVKVGDGDKGFESPTRELYGMDWGLGYFKPKACDWCDDIAGELADISCGDAWLPEYVSDPGGTSVLIVRNNELHDLLLKSRGMGQLHLNDAGPAHIVQSQAANYRHRREGLAVRAEDLRSSGEWYPIKRLHNSANDVTPERRRIYRLRTELANSSHLNFHKYKNRKLGFALFYLSMLPLEVKYYFYNKNLLKGMLKSCYSLVRSNFYKSLFR